MRWFIVPVSIGAHLMAAIALLVVPLAADVERPTPAPRHSVLLTTVVPVPPAVVALAPPPRVRSSVPLVAPLSLAREREALPDSRSTLAPDALPGPGRSTFIESGPPAGVGSPVPFSPPELPEQIQPSPRVPLRVGQGVREPRKILDVLPVYPPLALSARVQGPVILEAVINERGAVERVRVLRSIALLDAAAIDAVNRWRYTPTLLNGTPVAVLLTITINFRLNE
jgi:periplasmic protein TonB